MSATSEPVPHPGPASPNDSSRMIQLETVSAELDRPWTPSLRRLRRPPRRALPPDPRTPRARAHHRLRPAVPLARRAHGDPKRPVVLMAHYDVVPVDPTDAWTYPPFEGRIADGSVYGRGTLDDKGPLIVTLEAVENLLATGFTPPRDVYLSLGGNEETFGDAAQDDRPDLPRPRHRTLDRHRRGRRCRRRTPALRDGQARRWSASAKKASLDPASHRTGRRGPRIRSPDPDGGWPCRPRRRPAHPPHVPRPHATRDRPDARTLRRRHATTRPALCCASSPPRGPSRPRSSPLWAASPPPSCERRSRDHARGRNGRERAPVTGIRHPQPAHRARLHRRRHRPSRPSAHRRPARRCRGCSRAASPRPSPRPTTRSSR